MYATQETVRIEEGLEEQARQGLVSQVIPVSLACRPACSSGSAGMTAELRIE